MFKRRRKAQCGSRTAWSQVGYRLSTRTPYLAQLLPAEVDDGHTSSHDTQVHTQSLETSLHTVLLHCAAVSPPPQCALSISYDLRAHLGPQVRSPMSLRAGCASSTSTPLHTLQPTPPAPCASSHDARSKPISRSAAPRPTPDPTPPSPRPPRRAVPAARQRRPPPL